MRGLRPTIFAALNLWCLATLGDEAPILCIDSGGHTGIVMGLVSAPDGQLISGGYDKTVRVWDLKTGESLRVIRGQVGEGQVGTISAITLSPDGKTLLVSGWFDATEKGSHAIRVLDWPRGTVRGLLSGHDRSVRSMAFSSDGEFLATGDFGGILRLWRRRGDSFAEVAAVRAHGDRISNIAFDPSGGPLLATTGFDGATRLLGFGAGGLTEAGRVPASSMTRLYGLAFHPSGQVVAVAGAASSPAARGDWGEVRFFDRAGRPVGSALRFPRAGATSLAFSSDGRRLAVGCGFPGSDTRVVVSSFPDGRPVAEFNGHDDSVGQVTFLDDDRLIASSGGQDHAIRIWNSVTGQQHQVLGGRTRNLWSVGFSRDGHTILWGDRFHDAKKLLTIDEMNDRGPLDWGLNLNGPELVAGAEIAAVRGTIRHAGDRLELIDGARVARLARGSPPLSSGRAQDVIYGLTFLPGVDRRRLGAEVPVLLAGAEALTLGDAASGRRISELVGHSGLVHAVAPAPRGDFALSAGGDQTVRLWHLPSQQLRLSVFQAGMDWVAWTPQGHYAASAQGDRLIGWQINRGEDREPDFFVAAQFRKVLYRPDVIRRVFDSVAEPDAGVTRFAQIAPPHVQVVEPAVPADRKIIKLADKNLVVRAVARTQTASPVTAMRLLVDGRPFQGLGGVKKPAAASGGDVQEAWNVELTPGKHRVAVQAETADSKSVSQAVEVSFVGGSPDAVQLPSLYVLAVGISEYAGDMKLNYAAKDAEIVERTFRDKSSALFRRVESKLLADRDATRQQILQGLTWLRREMTQQDVAIVFFSGHGMNDSDGNYYLLPQNVDRENLLGTGIADGDLKKALAGIPGRVIAMLDTCHAGALGGDRRKAGPALSEDLIRDLVTDDFGVIVMASSMSREFSMESSRLQQGYFTLAVTEGLAGKADANGDGSVYLNELDGYVSDRVKELSQGRQHPVTAKPTSIRSFPLAKL